MEEMRRQVWCESAYQTCPCLLTEHGGDHTHNCCSLFSNLHTCGCIEYWEGRILSKMRPFETHFNTSNLQRNIVFHCLQHDSGHNTCRDLSSRERKLTSKLSYLPGIEEIEELHPSERCHSNEHGSSDASSGISSNVSFVD